MIKNISFYRKNISFYRKKITKYLPNIKLSYIILFNNLPININTCVELVSSISLFGV